MPDAKGWFPRSGVERFKEEAGGGGRVVRWVPTGDKRVEYTTHGDQMAEWRSVVTAQFPEYRSQINILRTTTSPAQPRQRNTPQFLLNQDKHSYKYQIFFTNPLLEFTLILSMKGIISQKIRGNQYNESIKRISFE